VKGEVRLLRLENCAVGVPVKSAGSWQTVTSEVGPMHSNFLIASEFIERIAGHTWPVTSEVAGSSPVGSAIYFQEVTVSEPSSTARFPFIVQ
jgi:hypothetical protein